MKTSLMEILELPNFGHMTISTLQLESRDKILFMTSFTKIILTRPGVALFVDIIKIIVMFIETIFKYSRKVKRIRNYVSKCNLYLYLLI